MQGCTTRHKCMIDMNNQKYSMGWAVARFCMKSCSRPVLPLFISRPCHAGFSWTRLPLTRPPPTCFPSRQAHAAQIISALYLTMHSEDTFWRFLLFSHLPFCEPPLLFFGLQHYSANMLLSRFVRLLIR